MTKVDVKAFEREVSDASTKMIRRLEEFKKELGDNIEVTPKLVDRCVKKLQEEINIFCKRFDIRDIPKVGKLRFPPDPKLAEMHDNCYVGYVNEDGTLVFMAEGLTKKVMKRFGQKIRNEL